MSDKAIVGTTSRIVAANVGSTLWWRVLGALRQQMVYVLLIVLVIAASLLSDVFLTPNNLVNIVRAVSVLGIVALGQTVLLIMAKFDMSVSMVVPFVGMI